MRVGFRLGRQSFAGIEIDSRHMADECRSIESEKSSGEADRFFRTHGVSERRAAQFPRGDLLDTRRAGVDVRIDTDDVLSARDLLRKLRQQLPGAKKCDANSRWEQIQHAMRHAVVASQRIAYRDAQSPHR